MIGTATLVIIFGGLWLYYAVIRRKPVTKQPRKSPTSYPVFPGTTPEESEMDDTLDEIDDIEGSI